ncbi:hypothetical protein CR513_24491, partial [Mucuna pruriens]
MELLGMASRAFSCHLWLMDRIFKDQTGHETKVYIDDMVVNSPSKNRHYEALVGVFVFSFTPTKN